MHRSRSCFDLIHVPFSRYGIALLLAGALLGVFAGSAWAADSKKGTDKPSAQDKVPVDPTCKTPNDANSKARPGASSAAAQEGESVAASGASQAGDSLKIKSGLDENPAPDADSEAESSKKDDASAGTEKKSGAPLQCERPAPKKDLTLPTSDKNGSPE